MVTPVAAPFLSAAFSLRSRSSSAFRSSSDMVTPGQLERPNGSFKSLSGTYPRFKLFLKITATASGIQHLTGFWWLVCWFVALVGWIPLAGTGLGIYGCGPQILSHGPTGAREYSWCRPPRIDLAQIM